jgi:hypothetical protein
MKVLVRGADDSSLSIVHKLKRLGFPPLACQSWCRPTHLSMTNNIERTGVASMEMAEAKETLWLKMIGHLTSVDPDSSSDFSAEELDGEMMALEAIYDKDFIRHSGKHCLSLSTVSQGMSPCQISAGLCLWTRLLGPIRV